MAEADLFPMDPAVPVEDLTPSKPMHSVSEQITSEIDGKYGTVLIDPPWRFANRTGKVGPEHKRLHHYHTLSFEEIAGLPIPDLSMPKSHLYLWQPGALSVDPLGIMKRWRNWTASIPSGPSAERKRAALYQLPSVRN